MDKSQLVIVNVFAENMSTKKYKMVFKTWNFDDTILDF